MPKIMSSNKNVEKSRKNDDNSSVDSHSKRKKNHLRSSGSNNHGDEDDDSDEDDEDWETESGDIESESDSDSDVSRSMNELSSSDDNSDSDSEISKKQLKYDVKSEEFRKLLYENFPSKYLKQKIIGEEKGKKSSSKKTVSPKKKSAKERDETSDDESSESRHHRSHKDKKRRKKSTSTQEQEDAEDTKNYSIILAALGGDGMDNDDEAEIEEMLNDKNEECGSDDEKTFMKESYMQIALPVETSNEKESVKRKRSKHIETVDVESEYLELIELKQHLASKLVKKPKSKILLSTYKDCKEAINKLIKKNRAENAKDYYKLIRTEEEESTCEIKYFKTKLSHKEQVKVISDLKEVNNHIRIDRPYRIMLLQSKMPIKYKATVMQKLNTMYSMEPSDPEYYKLKTWVDAFMRVPFDINHSLSVKLDDGIDVCSSYMKNAKAILDSSVYGLEDAKLQTMQMIGQWITNPAAMGSTIAIHGPMGTGKTSIVKEGISKILGREFAFIALGGAGDASFLEGHSYTYEGSIWGRIVQILMDSKCMNPIIYFDELDKVSDTARGQEIISVLTHLTDTTQNSQFHDKYFSEIDFDLSKCLFIFSYNDESKVSPILKDRMYRIQTKGYDTKEKLIIAKKYLLPKIREQVNFNDSDVVIPDDTISYIVTDARFTQNEQGVRNLKRCLEVIHTKLNLFRLVSDDDSVHILGKQVELKVTFPFTVTRQVVDALIKNEETLNPSLLAMYV